MDFIRRRYNERVEREIYVGQRFIARGRGDFFPGLKRESFRGGEEIIFAHGGVIDPALDGIFGIAIVAVAVVAAAVVGAAIVAVATGFARRITFFTLAAWRTFTASRFHAETVANTFAERNAPFAIHANYAVAAFTATVAIYIAKFAATFAAVARIANQTFRVNA